jgi:uncharacterized protein (DUF1697 family)
LDISRLSCSVGRADDVGALARHLNSLRRHDPDQVRRVGGNRLSARSGTPLRQRNTIIGALRRKAASEDFAMTVQIALLRAVNVAGNNKIAMTDLKAMMTELGFEARTLLQSGNVVLKGASFGGEKLERLLEAEAAKRLGLKTDFFVRSAGEWTELVAKNPFTKAAKDDPGHLLVLPLKNAPKAGAVEALQRAIKGRETVAAKGRQLYAVYPDGIGRSKLTIAMIEKALGTRTTGRNWNTVLKLAALAAIF